MLRDIQPMCMCGAVTGSIGLPSAIPPKSGYSVGICMLGTSEGTKKAKRRRKTLGQGRTRLMVTAGGKCGARSRCEVEVRAGQRAPELGSLREEMAQGSPCHLLPIHPRLWATRREVFGLTEAFAKGTWMAAG